MVRKSGQGYIYEDGEEGREANAEAIEMLQRNEFNMQ